MTQTSINDHIHYVDNVQSAIASQIKHVGNTLASSLFRSKSISTMTPSSISLPTTEESCRGSL